MGQETKHLPVIETHTKAYWDACRDGKLLIQNCQKCGNLQFYPRTVCINCLSEELGWVRASGKGTVYAFSTIHQAPTPAYAGDIPYSFAIIDLEEGVRMTSNVIDCKPEDVKVGMAVEVVFRSHSPEIAVPYFRPRR